MNASKTNYLAILLMTLILLSGVAFAFLTPSMQPVSHTYKTHLWYNHVLSKCKIGRGPQAELALAALDNEFDWFTYRELSKHLNQRNHQTDCILKHLRTDV